jgi:STE24 endopeptidase
MGGSREHGWWLAAGAAALIATAVMLLGLLPPDVDPAEGLIDARASALEFPPEVLGDIAAYRAPRRTVALMSRIVATLVPLGLAMMIVGPRGERLLRPLRRLPGIAMPVGVAVAVTVVITALLRLPLSVWAGIVQDGAWGFRTRSVVGWAADQAVLVLGRAVLLGLLTVGVVALIRRHPRSWPARLTVGVAVLGPLVLLLHPVVVHPLLLPTGPLPDGPHRDAVITVLSRSSSGDVPVLLGEASLRTTRRNAVATGLGPTERIVLHDTLLDLDPREVAAIAAHELAHLERRDPLRGAIAPVPVVLVVALIARRRLEGVKRGRTPQIRALAAVGALMLAAESALMPLTAALSRTIEHRTDVRAVALSGDVDAYVGMLRRFVIDGLAEPEPPRWSVVLWATHPVPATRIGAVLDAGVPLSGPLDLATR